MRSTKLFAIVYLCLLALQGCATTSDTTLPPQQQPVSSPIERLSAGSGGMHTGMVAPPGVQ